MAKPKHATMAALTNYLKRHIGFEDVKVETKKRVSIGVPISSRQARADMLNPKHPNYILRNIVGKYVPPGTSISEGGIKSGAGALVTNMGFIIVTHPMKGVSRGNAGKDNEKFFQTTINQYCQLFEEISILFVGKNRRKLFTKVTRVEDVSGSGSTRNQVIKADMVLVRAGTNVRISLKQEDANFWGTETRKFAQKLANTVIDLRDRGKVEFREHRSNKKVIAVIPEVGVKLSKEDAALSVFGDDMKSGRGFVVKQTFMRDDFIWIPRNKTLVVRVEKIIERVFDLDSKDYPWLITNNNSSKAGILADHPKVRKRGVTARSVTESRITRNTVKIKKLV